MVSSNEIVQAVERIQRTPDMLLDAKVCPECFAFLPDADEAIVGHRAWHERIEGRQVGGSLTREVIDHPARR